MSDEHEQQNENKNENTNLNNGKENNQNDQLQTPENMSQYSDQSSQFTRGTILILLIIASIGFVPMIYLFLVPIGLASTLATISYPIYKWLHRHLWKNKIIASFTCCFVLILGVLLPLYIVVHLAFNQLISVFPTMIPWVKNFMNTWQEQAIVKWFIQTPIGNYLFYQVNLESIGRDVLKNLTSLASIIVNRTYTGVFGLAFDLGFTIFMLFYFYMDGVRIVNYLKSIVPIKASYKQMLVDRFVRISRATILGTIILGLIEGFVGALTLLIFGVKGWLFWGFVMVILSILPIVGVSTVLVPAGVIQILLGNIWQGIGILITLFVLFGNLENFLRPRIVGSSARMHDLIILISTIGGLSIFGITGFIIGPIIAALFLTVLDIYKEEFCPQITENN